jgi:hypothetical protein
VNKKEAKKTLLLSTVLVSRSGGEVKRFFYCGRWPGWCTRPQEQKFFASFFQKRSASFVLTRPVMF